MSRKILKLIILAILSQINLLLIGMAGAGASNSTSNHSPYHINRMGILTATYHAALKHFKLKPIDPQANIKIEVKTQESIMPELDPDPSLKKSRQTLYLNKKQSLIADASATIYHAKFFESNAEEPLVLNYDCYVNIDPLTDLDSHNPIKQINRLSPEYSKSLPTHTQIILDFQIHEYLPYSLLRHGTLANRTIDIQLAINPLDRHCHYSSCITKGIYDATLPDIKSEIIDIKFEPSCPRY